MEIKFESYLRDDCTETLSIIVNDDYTLFLKVLNEHVKGKDDKYAFYNIDKTQLSDFIGALLHIQQKINKHGRK